MVMRKSANDHLAAIKQQFEDLKRVKYEQFMQKHFYRQILSNEKKSEYYMRLKMKAQELTRRHREAAARRKVLTEEKQTRILARKQSRSESRESRSGSFSEVVSSSKPGVFVTKILSSTVGQGTAGFGRGYVRRPDCVITRTVRESEMPAASADQRSSSWSPILLSADERATSLTRSTVSEQSLKSEKERVTSSDWTACSDISYNHSFYNPAPLMVDNAEHQKCPDTRYIIPEKQLKKFIDDSRKYRALRSLKRVSFDSSRQVQKISKPVIKKSLQIDTPETKRGILLKMTEVNSRKRVDFSTKCEPEVPNLSMLTSAIQREIDLAGKGDSFVVNKENGARTHLFSETPRGEQGQEMTIRPSSPMKVLVDDTYNCGKLLETREFEKKDRKMKLLQLQEDLKNIEIETKRLSSKNAEVARNLRAKESEYKK